MYLMYLKSERFTSKCELTLDNFYNINFFNKTIYDLVINSNYKENIKNIFLNYNESEVKNSDSR